MPYGTVEEARLLNNATNKNLYGVRCRVARIEDLFLLKQSIANDYEPRHQMDVEFIARDCKKNISTSYLKDGIRALNMQTYIPYFERILMRNLS